MFKELFILLLLTLTSHALDLDFKNFSADFTQVVVDENKKELKYEGKLYAKYPSTSYWNYVKPIKKEIYINENVVTLVEPDLEQVIIQNIENQIDLIRLMKDAKKISDTFYEKTYLGTTYTIKMKNNLPSNISYKDKFDNKVSILLSNIDTSTILKSKTFKANYSSDFDVIKQ